MMNSTMEKSLSSQASDWCEGRRLRAFKLKERGWKQTEIADALGVTEGAGCQPVDEACQRGGGGKLVRHKTPLGATPRLSGEERAGLDRKSTRLNSSHANTSYAVFCLTKKEQGRFMRHIR